MLYLYRKLLFGYVYDGVFLCCPFSHKMSWVIWDLIEAVSAGFPSFSLR